MAVLTMAVLGRLRLFLYFSEIFVCSTWHTPWHENMVSWNVSHILCMHLQCSVSWCEFWLHHFLKKKCLGISKTSSRTTEKFYSADFWASFRNTGLLKTLPQKTVYWQCQLLPIIFTIIILLTLLGNYFLIFYIGFFFRARLYALPVLSSISFHKHNLCILLQGSLHCHLNSLASGVVDW